MKKNFNIVCWLFTIMLIASCTTYSGAVKVEMSQPTKFKKKVVYAGIRLKKGGIYRQVGSAGDVIRGFRNSFNTNIPKMTVFGEVIPKHLINNGEKKLPDDYLTLIVENSYIYTSMDGLGKATVRAKVLMFEKDSNQVVYKKLYSIVRTSGVSTPSAFQSAMHDLISRVVEDLAKGKFDDPDYIDIEESVIKL